MDTAMYGVVLWSDPDVRKAVIWCEECGALDLYEEAGGPWHEPGGFFEPGDYVEYEMSDGTGCRRAVNPQTLRSADSPRISEALQADGAIQSAAELRLRDLSAGRVVNFSDHRPKSGGPAPTINRRD